MRPAEPVADRLPCRLFLILHDTFSGKPVVGAAALRCAVVGAQLAELVLCGRLGLPGGRVELAHARRQDDDELAGFVVDAVATQEQAHDVPTWVATLADPVLDMVTDTLGAQRIVHRGGKGLFGLGAERYPALNLLASARPRVRLEHMIRRPSQMDRAGAVCAGLLGAVGAHKALDVDGDRARVRRGIDAAAESLPDELRTLLAGVEVAQAAQALPSSLRLRASGS